MTRTPIARDLPVSHLLDLHCDYCDDDDGGGDGDGVSHGEGRLLDWDEP